MKFITTILLISAIVFCSVGKTVLYWHYEINVSEITARFCENKNRPEMKCNGKCHLTKQFQKHEGHSKSQGKSLRESIREITYFVMDVSKNAVSNYLPLSSSHLYVLNEGFTSGGFLHELLQPPLV